MHQVDPPPSMLNRVQFHLLGKPVRFEKPMQGECSTHQYALLGLMYIMMPILLQQNNQSITDRASGSLVIT